MDENPNTLARVKTGVNPIKNARAMCYAKPMDIERARTTAKPTPTA